MILVFFSVPPFLLEDIMSFLKKILSFVKKKYTLCCKIYFSDFKSSKRDASLVHLLHFQRLTHSLQVIFKSVSVQNCCFQLQNRI